jgi:hypothetical protein
MTMVTKFNPSSTMAARAVQAWQILVAQAMTRQTLTYDDLGKLMFQKKAAGVLDKILGHVAFFCNDHKLPPLTSIVVGKGRGTPGPGIPVTQARMDKEREKVYKRDWYDIYPPTEAELKAAYDARP